MRLVPRCAPPLAALVLAAAGCSILEDLGRNLEKPSARIAGARLQDLSLDAVTLLLDVYIGNPYAVPLPLVKLEYGLSSAGKGILSGSADPGGSVPARGSRVVPVPVRIGFPGLLAALRDVKPGSVIPYAADLTLSADAPGAGLLSLPLRKEGELPVPAAPEVQVAGLRWEEVGLERAAAVVSLGIRNTNRFPVDLSKLSYALTLAGSRAAEGSVDRPISFAPGADGSVDLRLAFSPKSLGLAVLSAITGGKAAYRLAGSMALGTPYGALAVPFDRGGETTLRRP
jgi:LEA14-like dessication related protein